MGKTDRRQHKDASPTERALSEIRHRGWYAVPCEHWKPAGGRCCLCRTASVWRRADFGGFADIVALPSLVAIQVTSDSNHSARVNKILKQRPEAAWWWLEAGGLIQVWSWRLNSAGRWVFRHTPIVQEDLDWLPPDIQQELL